MEQVNCSQTSTVIQQEDENGTAVIGELNNNFTMELPNSLTYLDAFPTAASVSVLASGVVVRCQPSVQLLSLCDVL